MKTMLGGAQGRSPSPSHHTGLGLPTAGHLPVRETDWPMGLLSLTSKLKLAGHKAFMDTNLTDRDPTDCESQALSQNLVNRDSSSLGLYLFGSPHCERRTAGPQMSNRMRWRPTQRDRVPGRQEQALTPAPGFPCQAAAVHPTMFSSQLSQRSILPSRPPWKRGTRLSRVTQPEAGPGQGWGSNPVCPTAGGPGVQACDQDELAENPRMPGSPSAGSRQPSRSEASPQEKLLKQKGL